MILNIKDLKPINDVALRKPVDIYIGDLLSCVMANIEPESLWITTQTNMNVMAIAHLHELVGIIFVEGMEPDQNVISKANECEVSLFTYPGHAFRLALELKDYVL